MNTLFESFWSIVIVGVLVTTVLIGAWLQTGKKPLLIVGLLALLVMAILLGVERRVVTEREKVEATIYRVAREVEKFDLQAVLALIHPDAKDIQATATSEFRLYKIKEVSIKPGMKIEIDMKRQPPEATAKFNVVVVGGDAAGVFTDQRVPRFISLTFQKEGDEWKVWDYEHHDPHHDMLLNP